MVKASISFEESSFREIFESWLVFGLLTFRETEVSLDRSRPVLDGAVWRPEVPGLDRVDSRPLRLELD